MRYFVDIGIIVSTLEFRNGDGVEPLLSLKLNFRKNPAGCNWGGRNDVWFSVFAFEYDDPKLLFLLFLEFWSDKFVTESLTSLDASFLTDWFS